jgi:hypothetical protein
MDPVVETPCLETPLQGPLITVENYPFTSPGISLIL